MCQSIQDVITQPPLFEKVRKFSEYEGIRLSHGFLMTVWVIGENGPLANQLWLPIRIQFPVQVQGYTREQQGIIILVCNNSILSLSIYCFKDPRNPLLNRDIIMIIDKMPSHCTSMMPLCSMSEICQFHSFQLV